VKKFPYHLYRVF